jgi:hypothetical protein
MTTAPELHDLIDRCTMGSDGASDAERRLVSLACAAAPGGEELMNTADNHQELVCQQWSLAPMLPKSPAHACKQGGKLCLTMRPSFCEHGVQLCLCGGHGDTMRLGNRRKVFSNRTSLGELRQA